MEACRNRRGSTLPVAILLVALLTIGLAAGFTQMSADRRVSGDNQAQVKALSVAETGLERYIAAVSVMPGASHDSTITGMPGGRAFISLRRVRDAMGGLPALYVVRSRGVDTTARRYDPNAPTAERIVAQYVTWRVTRSRCRAAGRASAGLTKNGGSGTLSGTDACGAKPPVAGVAVPNLASDGTPGYGQNGGSSVPTGTPPIAYLGTVTQAADAIDIDWAGVVGGNVVSSHYMINTTVSPTEGNWPTTTQMNAWPVIKVTGDYSIPSGGKGTLIVDRQPDDHRVQAVGRDHPGGRNADVERKQHRLRRGGHGSQRQARHGGRRERRRQRHEDVPIPFLRHRQRPVPVRGPAADSKRMGGQLA